MSDEKTAEAPKRRPADWPEKLDLFIQEKRDQPFEWGVNDCCLFAADWLVILTGIDPAADVRGYTGELEAWRIVKDKGGVEQMARDAFAAQGWTESPIGFARRGDIVAIDGDHGASLGVCCGPIAAFAGPEGVVFRKFTDCKTSWRVL